MNIQKMVKMAINASVQAQVLTTLATNDKLRQDFNIAIDESISYFADKNRLSLRELIEFLKRKQLAADVPFRVEYYYKDKFAFGVKLLFENGNHIIEKYSKDNYLIS